MVYPIIVYIGLNCFYRVFERIFRKFGDTMISILNLVFFLHLLTVLSVIFSNKTHLLSTVYTQHCSKHWALFLSRYKNSIWHRHSCSLPLTDNTTHFQTHLFNLPSGSLYLEELTLKSVIMTLRLRGGWEG